MQVMQQGQNVMKSVFTEGRFEKIEESINTLNTIQFQIDTLKQQIENCISKNEIDQVNVSLKGYAPLN